MRHLLSILALSYILIGCSSTPNPAPITSAPAAEVPTTASQRQSHSNRANLNSAPAVFDFYLLTLSWSPQYCATDPSSPECAAHPGFVVHGLWPENNNGTYPEDCSKAPGPADPSADTDILPTVALIKHEWTTHGTCSGMAADAYFNTIRKAFHEVIIPAEFQNLKTKTSLTPKAIIAQFAKSNPSFPASSVVVSCGNNVLTAVEVCLSKTLQPQACQAVKTCGATTIKITPQ
jgi:ribonuclease T2